MTTNLYRVSGGTTGAPSDLDQVVDALTGNNDTDIVAYVQITAPTAPNVALSTTQGVLSGNYQYAVGFGTGYCDAQCPKQKFVNGKVNSSLLSLDTA